MNIQLQKKTSLNPVELLIMGVFKDAAPLPKTLEKIFGNEMKSFYESFGTLNETAILHCFSDQNIKKILLIGLGKKEQYSSNVEREAVETAIKAIKKEKSVSISVDLNSFVDAQSVVEAIYLTSHQPVAYKTTEQENPIQNVYLLTEEISEELSSKVSHGKAVGEGVIVARDLTNMPGNMLTPAILARKAEEIANGYGFTYQCLSEKEIQEKQMGALWAVGKGSVNPPRMIVLSYQGNPNSGEIVGLIGKGITFDTGGISLKSREGMEDMKMDMGGAATVLGVMETVGRLKPTCNILAVIASAENMPSGNALKPGDVITSYSGKTIEIKNTDAEGRLVLSDAITYAKELGATKLIDLSTLTGAAVVALGNVTTAAITNNQDFKNDFFSSAEAVGEYVWELPHYEPYKKMVKSSQFADLNNAPGRPAGAITAGLFIGEFAEETPWIHLDIAGTAWNKKGIATGVMVRSLVHLITKNL